MSTQQRKTIGHIWIGVGKTLEASWYKKYQDKKLRRLELLQTHGYTDIRGPEKKMWTLKAYERLSDEIFPYTKADGIPSTSSIKLELEGISAEIKRPLSIITRDSLVSNIHALLNLKWELLYTELKLKKMQTGDIAESLQKKQHAIKKRLARELERIHEADRIYEHYYEGTL